MLIKVQKIALFKMGDGTKVSQLVTTSTGIQLSMDKHGNLKTGLDSEDEARLEPLLGLNAGDLKRPPRIPKAGYSSFWDTFMIMLPARTLTLDTDLPEDELQYKALMVMGKLVATSVADQQTKPDARYVLLNEETEAKAKVTANSFKKQAYQLIGKWTQADFSNFLFVWGFDATHATVDPRSMDQDGMSLAVDELIEEDAQEFLKVAKDASLKIKAKVGELLRAGILESRSGGFAYEGGMIARDLEEAVTFLEDKINSVRVAAMYKELKERK